MRQRARARAARPERRAARSPRPRPRGAVAFSARCAHCATAVLVRSATSSGAERDRARQAGDGEGHEVAEDQRRAVRLGRPGRRWRRRRAPACSRGRLRSISPAGLRASRSRAASGARPNVVSISFSVEAASNCRWLTVPGRTNGLIRNAGTRRPVGGPVQDRRRHVVVPAAGAVPLHEQGRASARRSWRAGCSAPRASAGGPSPAGAAPVRSPTSTRCRTPPAAGATSRSR